MEKVVLNTKCGQIEGVQEDGVVRFLGVRYATAKRFEYPKMIEKWQNTFEATKVGDACVQPRSLYDLSNIPERAFYHKEFRLGKTFTYSEDCLNLNIYAPENAKDCPVLVYIHGGGFNSGCNSELYIDGEEYCKRGIILVAINYRVGILGYLTSKQLYEKVGREGNYGLADQYCAISWVKKNISDYGGNPNKITLIGQSAGAISIQYLCLSQKCVGLFNGAIMLSGGGIMPKFACPKQASKTRPYWEQVLSYTKAKNFEEFRNLPLIDLFDAVEKIKTVRKDNQFNTMPVIDGDLITDDVTTLSKSGNQLDIPYICGSTSNDMLSLIVQNMSNKWTTLQNVQGKHDSYTYFFDRQLPGDNNGAFHSSDLYYVFGTLKKCWRKFEDIDYSLSKLMIDYLANFIYSGNPNGNNLPLWLPNTKKQRKSMRFGLKYGKMYSPNKLSLLFNTIKNKDPK